MVRATDHKSLAANTGCVSIDMMSSSERETMYAR